MKKILVVTGEESGDKQFALFWKKISSFLPESKLWGIGGRYFKEIGGEVVFPQDRLSVMGIAEVVRKLSQIKEAERTILTHPYLRDTHMVFLVDFPGFNFKVGTRLSKMGKKIVYFIPPKVWVWGRSRIKKMKRFVDLVLYIFPFEEKIYGEAGINAVFVGNPAVRHFREKISEISVNRDSILLLPGSREFEVKNLFPLMLKTVKHLRARGYDLRVKVPVATSIHIEFIKKMIFEQKVCFPIVADNENYEEMLMSGVMAISASGTANLEVAVAGVPQIIGYRVSPVTYEIGRRVVNLEFASPVNILAGRELVPELLQNDYTLDNLLAYSEKILEEKEYRSKIIEGYKEIVSVLTDRVDWDRVGAEILKLL